MKEQSRHPLKGWAYRMARRRMISAELISDERFNSISLGAQNVFIRMLSVSDDCGVVPASTYRLNTIINTPTALRNGIQALINEIVRSGMGVRFDYEEEPFFAFKARSFREFQSYILKKATKSEYLRISIEDYAELSKNFSESLGASRKFFPNEKKSLSTVKSRKQRVESKQQKEESKKQEDVNKILASIGGANKP